jgi:hypothetical protein
MDLDKTELPERIRERIRLMNDAPFIRSFGIELVSISGDGEVRLTMDVSDKYNALGSALEGRFSRSRTRHSRWPRTLAPSIRWQCSPA